MGLTLIDLTTEEPVRQRNPCVVNKMVNKSQHTVRFHVDDLLASPIDPKVNNDFELWLNKMYGTYGEVKCL